MRIFVAGATGAIGRPLVRLLREAGMDVVGTTRSKAKAEALEAAGAQPVILDMYDADAVMRAVATARPEVVIHQLTDLPQTIDPASFADALARNAKLRVEATPILMAASKAARARRVIVQSVSFIYAAGPTPHDEEDAVDSSPNLKTTIDAVTTMERTATGMPGIEGVVLRYGRLYGPGTWTPVANGTGPLHVDAAAHAALLAISNGKPGIYNVAEDDGSVSSEKAKRELGFDASFRIRS